MKLVGTWLIWTQTWIKFPGFPATNGADHWLDYAAILGLSDMEVKKKSSNGLLHENKQWMAVDSIILLGINYSSSLLKLLLIPLFYGMDIKNGYKYK